MLLTPVSSWVCPHSAHLEVLATQLCTLQNPNMRTQRAAAWAALPVAQLQSSSISFLQSCQGHILEVCPHFLWSRCPCCRGCCGAADLHCPIWSSSLTHSSAASLKGFWAGWKSCCSRNLLWLLNRCTFMSKQESLGAYSFFSSFSNGESARDRPRDALPCSPLRDAQLAVPTSSCCSNHSSDFSRASLHPLEVCFQPGLC